MLNWRLLALGNRLSASAVPTRVIGAIRSFSKDCGIVNIQDPEDFKEKVTNNDLPVLVDFHASWCGPCKMLGPRLEDVMAKHMDKVLLAKVDVDAMEELAMQYEVSAVPTVIGMKCGKEVSRFTGLKEEAEIERFIQELCN
ncbi:unnamed protein product [Mesocestoides corti]|uniref:Thioredoxin n=1 Tax=Mesocestoides corti TaxID=53468 RepID=A0A0R3U846_MESCO|nr:unnamed protein product [Mesocestoides corti]